VIIFRPSHDRSEIRANAEGRHLAAIEAVLAPEGGSASPARNPPAGRYGTVTEERAFCGMGRFP